MPEWMSRAAGAIRDALRALPIAEGTVLEAALAGTGDLGEELLANVGIPESQVHAGVRLRRMPARPGVVVQTYRRAPAAATADDADADVLAAVEVPIAGVFELDTARRVWLATRRVVVATLPPGTVAPRRGVALRAGLATGSDREHGNVPLITRLLAGILASFRIYAGDDLDDAALRLAAELGGDPAEMTMLLSSPRGAVLGSHDRFGEAEVTVAPGTRPQLEIQLRAIQPGPS
jgi:hypothetical protein